MYNKKFDLIDCKPLITSIKRSPAKMIDGKHYVRLDSVTEKIRSAPTIDAVPVVHAEWDHWGGDEWKCTNCAGFIYAEGSWEKPWQKYCPNCGAKMKMDGGDSDD